MRHDTILYAKQSYTPVPISVPPESDPGYAEPMPEFYHRLLSLTRMTRTGLDNLQVLNAVQRDRLMRLEDILVCLRDIAISELESRPLTGEQCNLLAFFGEVLAPLVSVPLDGFDANAALVADVHTDDNTFHVLEEGVGYLKLMVVAYQRPGGSLVLGAGPVMSYYEFKWPMNDRLTDEHWADFLASDTQPNPPVWTSAFAEPVTLPPEDRDGDRLPDAWEQSWWAGTNVVNSRSADADSDGLTNEQEAIAGTDPTNHASSLDLLAVRGEAGRVNLRWRSVPGRTYRMRCSEDLSNWRLLGVPVTASGETAVLLDSSTNSTAVRFYRLEVVR